MDHAVSREQNTEAKKNMIFHFFLCCFLLWLGVAGNILCAVLCFSSPAEMNNPAYDTLIRDVLALDEDLSENVALPLFTCNESKQLPRSEETGDIAPQVTAALGKIMLLSAADGAVCTALPAMLGMSVTGSFTADGILRLLLAAAGTASALLLIRKKRLGALLVQVFYLANTVLLVILMFTRFSFPYLAGFFASFLMAGFTTVYYVRRKQQLSPAGVSAAAR